MISNSPRVSIHTKNEFHFTKSTYTQEIMNSNATTILSSAMKNTPHPKKISCLKGEFAKNERGYRRDAKNKRF